MKRLAILALGASIVAPAAFAGGLSQPVVEAPVAPAPVYVAPAPDGEWGGAYVGAQLGYGKAKIDPVDGDGAIGGVYGGYRWDLGKTVLGVEAAYSGSDVKDDDYDAKLKNLGQLKLQAGYDLGRTLVYATAGVAHGKVSVAGADYSDTGYLVGLGVDYQVNDQWTIGGEALYNRFDSFDGTGEDLKVPTVSVKAAFRF